MITGASQIALFVFRGLFRGSEESQSSFALLVENSGWSSVHSAPAPQSKSQARS